MALARTDRFDRESKSKSKFNSPNTSEEELGELFLKSPELFLRRQLRPLFFHQLSTLPPIT